MVGFDEKLDTLTSVDSVSNTLEVAVVNMASSKTERRPTRVDVLPVVVGICDREVALIFCAVGVAVTDEGGFPVIVDVAVGDCDKAASVGDLYSMMSEVFLGEKGKRRGAYINQAIIVNPCRGIDRMRHRRGRPRRLWRVGHQGHHHSRRELWR